MQVAYKWLDSKDMKQVVELHRKTFSIEQLRQTIYFSPTVCYYLENIVSYPHLQKFNYFFGAWLKNKLIAYAHYKIIKDSLHLNNIVVDPIYQGYGIGRHLIDEWFNKAQETKVRQITLDVTESNRKAYEWYLRLGLKALSKKWVYECVLSPNKFLSKDSMDCFKLLEWENTMAWWRTYGFTKIRLDFYSIIWEVGWIHESLKISSNFPCQLFDTILFLAPKARWLFMESKEKILQFQDCYNKCNLSDVIVRMKAHTSEK